MMFKNFPVKYDAQEWLDLYRWAEKEHNLPEGLLTAIAVHGEKTNADRVSSAGARTPLQIIPDTRNSALRMWDVDAYSSPQAAAWVAGRLLRDSMDRNNGDVGAAVREYHGGTNRANWGNVNQAYHDRVMAGWGGNEPAWYQDDQQGSGDLADMVTDARNGYQNELTDAENYLNAPDIDTLFQQSNEPMTVTITGHAGSEEPQDIMSVLGGGQREEPEESPVIEAGRETLARYKDGKMDDAERRAFELAVAAGEVTVPQGFQVAKRVDWRKVAQKGDRRSTMETIGDTAQDIGAGIAGIFPAAIGGVGSAVEFEGNLVGWEGAEKLGKGVADAMSATAGKINETIGSDYSNEAQAALADMMDDDTATADDVVDFILSHKAAIGREAIAGIGSMLMPMGMAGAAGKLAKARKASEVAQKLARVFGSSVGSGAMMAGGEYHDARNEGMSEEDARSRAAVAGGTGLVTGAVLGGMNPEARLAGMMSGNIGRGAMRAAGTIGLGEGLEEAGQNLVNDAAQSIINGDPWNLNRSMKEAIHAGAAGMGSGAAAGYGVGRMTAPQSTGGGGVLDALRNASPAIASKAMEWLRSKNNNSQLSEEQIQAAIDNMTRAAQLGIDLPFGMALDNKNLHAFLSDVMTKDPDMALRTGLTQWVDGIGKQLEGALSENVAASVDPLTAGAQWNAAMEQKRGKMQNDYRELYGKADESGENLNSTDVQSVRRGGAGKEQDLIGYLESELMSLGPNGQPVPFAGLAHPENRIAAKVFKALYDNHVLETGEDGNVKINPISIDQIQSLKRLIAANVNNADPSQKRQAAEIRNFLNDLRANALQEAGMTKGESYIEQADKAYGEYAGIFGDQSTSLWTDEKSAKNSSDKVADSQVVDKFMGMTPEDIRKNFAILENENPDAVQQIRGGIMARIMSNAQSGKGSNETRLNGDRLAAEVKKLDASGQLDAIFGEQNAQNMRDISAITNIVESVRKHYSGEVTDEQISNLESSAMSAWKKFNSMTLMYPAASRGSKVLYSRFLRGKNENLINNIIKGGFGDDTQAALTKALGAGVYDSPDKASARPVPRSPLEGTSDPYRYDQPPVSGISGFDMGGAPDLFNPPEGNNAAQQQAEQQAQQQAQQDLTASIQDVLASVMELARDNPELAKSINKIINGGTEVIK